MTIVVSRRNLIAVGACALAGAATFPGAASARPFLATAMTNEEIIRKYYKAWEKRDWAPIDIVLADNFTFTSPNNDDHISKSAFKTRCWESQVDLIDHFELESVIGSGNEAFAKGLCRTKNKKSFRNVEYFRFSGQKVEAIECYFGGPGFPSAANKAQG